MYRNAAALKTANRIHYNIKRKEIVIGFPSPDDGVVGVVDVALACRHRGKCCFCFGHKWRRARKKHSFSALYRIMACVNGGNMVWRRRRCRKMGKRIKKFCFGQANAEETTARKNRTILNGNHFSSLSSSSSSAYCLMGAISGMIFKLWGGYTLLLLLSFAPLIFCVQGNVQFH